MEGADVQPLKPSDGEISSMMVGRRGLDVPKLFAGRRGYKRYRYYIDDGITRERDRTEEEGCQWWLWWRIELGPIVSALQGHEGR